MEATSWLDGNVGEWVLRGVAYHTNHPLLTWVTADQPLHHGDIICLRGDAGTAKSLLLQFLISFLMPQSVGGIGTECLLLLGNDGISPHLIKEQIIARLARANVAAAGQMEDIVLQSLANLHVVSIASVQQLQQFVSSLPELLNVKLKCCRVIVFDDLDLGMASVPSFAPRITELTDVLHSLLQAVSHHGLLMFYGVKRRITRDPRVLDPKNPPSISMDYPQHPHTAMHAIQQLTRENATRMNAQPLHVQRTPCQADLWRPPRKFVLHLFCDATQQQQELLQEQQQQNKRYPSRFLCTSETEGSCIFQIDGDGQITLVYN